MIYGIGTDLVDPSRIERSLERHGNKFARRILTDPEWEEYQNSCKPALFLAGRFAAKEALSKAMGTGLRHPVNLDFITITHDSLGKPYFQFHPELDRLISEKGIVNHYLSISDEMNLACAFVVLEK
ncbi:MAG: holo-ACP synthase [Nitrosomonas sp.]|nr:holo-ACP synthase [Nitrosomonas sp.]MBX3640162.1 holo-ACP synthase [Nitrosomonas sp.]MCW5606648.1 holo-ACP synthase [Nitrosomonas sp.]